MDGEEFQKFVVEKLINIENRITNLEAKLVSYERLTKIIAAVAAVLAAKLRIDISGLW